MENSFKQMGGPTPKVSDLVALVRGFENHCLVQLSKPESSGRDLEAVFFTISQVILGIKIG